jgi:hypothetical protein
MPLVHRLIGRVSPKTALREALRLIEKRELKRALPLLSRAANAGIAEAEFHLGRFYLEGSAVPVSRAHAVRWLERAGNQGYVEAQTLLAHLYLHGLAPGGEQSRGGAQAESIFGSNKTGEPDYVAAAGWARRAADGGSGE